MWTKKTEIERIDIDEMSEIKTRGCNETGRQQRNSNKDTDLIRASPRTPKCLFIYRQEMLILKTRQITHSHLLP